ncbi:hypothetical protein D3C81_1296490 [compost metagenome]
MFRAVRWIDRQRQVGEQFAEEEVAAGLAVQHQGVLADPAEPGLFGDGLFQHRRAVDEGAVAERADGRLHALGQLLQALADQLVVVAAQRVARDVGFLRGGEDFRHPRIARQVVHAQRNHPQGAGNQLVRAPALAAVGAHVVHLTVIAGLQPALQVRAVGFQVETADADLLEAELAPPVLYVLGDIVEVGG